MCPFLGEFMGTLILILLGDGVVANVLLKQSKGENSGWIVITAGWGFAVMAGVYTSIAFGGPDAHLNPAVTVGFAALSGDWSKLSTYIPAQFLGAFVGAILVWLHYLPHWKETENPGLKLAVFSTGPAIRNTCTNFISEFIGTAVLIIGIAAIFSKAVSATGPVPGSGPFIVGFLIWSIGLSLGGPTGYAINPARDLGPRIANAILPIAGKGGSDWGYSWIPVVAPIAGALVAAFILKAIA